MEIITAENLKRYCYFSRLSDDALELLAEKLQIGEAPAGTEIIREGEPAESFYIICYGQVEVSKKTEWGQKSILSVVGEGVGIGEMALLTCSPRTATVTARTDIKFYKLSKEDFNEIVRNDSAFSAMLEEKSRDYSKVNKFKTLQPFALLPAEKMAALTSKLTERKYAPGEKIIFQGEEGDSYYIIKSGRVDVMKLMFDVNPEKVASLGEGEAFGEEALITNSPRNATVQAAEETVVWRLSRDDFNDIMKPSFLREVSQDEIPVKLDSGHAILDVRMDMEYEDEHIPDALNIPLDELRKRYSDLDPSKEYYVYCLGGARSASATFLLQSQGFKAKSIRGGLSSWSGPVTGGGTGVHPPSTTPT
ncbi:MAG: cyclic nucleotide-binding domain-containing protein [Nitrospirae bacterium]|nr:cyclic nucleotide-binding domain-containing protein [Nitrospirota bacterium]